MDFISNSILYIVVGLVTVTLVVSLTFLVLPPEKLETYKETITSILQRTPEVKLEVSQPDKTK